VGRTKEILPQVKKFRRDILIFVTVGTHEQQFNRLLEKVNFLKKENYIEDVIIQSGYSNFKADDCYSKNIMSFDEMEKYISESRITITHGGPGSIFSVFSHGKVPIVVPRDPSFGEHVDIHQIDFVKRMERLKKIIAVYDIESLKEVIVNYDKLVSELRSAQNRFEKRNNFVGKFTNTVNALFK
jgi:UDP-N-acetylglucosamine transferase subunit ALG13